MAGNVPDPWQVDANAPTDPFSQSAGDAAFGESAAPDLGAKAINPMGPVGIAAGLFGTFSQMSAEENAAQARYNADRTNAALANMRAADALARGAQAAGALRMRGSATISAQRAAYGASGVDTNVGTAAQVQSGTRVLSELDVARVKNNAAREALGSKIAEQQFNQQAAVDDTAGDQEAMGTFLSGMGSVAKAGAGMGGV